MQVAYNGCGRRTRMLRILQKEIRGQSQEFEHEYVSHQKSAEDCPICLHQGMLFPCLRRMTMCAYRQRHAEVATNLFRYDPSPISYPKESP